MTLRSHTAFSLRTGLFAKLPAEVCAVIECVAADPGVYAVGGVVRDLMLGRRLVDVDLTTEGDAIDLSQRAARGAKVTTHQRFRTASFTVGGIDIDVATARRETYTRPGALPRVEAADIETDLRRRDFTINAMALSLNGEARLVDPMSGVADIEARVVRVLHPRSFEDDATRIFRAIRYAARLGFEIESETLRLMAAGLGLVGTISGPRIRRELELLLLEPTAGEALEAAGAHGALRAIHADMHWDAERSKAWTDDALRSIPRLPFGFALLAAGATTEGAAHIVERLRLHKDEAEAVLGLAAMSKTTAMLRRPGAKPSGVVVLLDRYPVAAVAAYAATAGDQIAAQVALRYLAEWRHVRPFLHGDELIALGVPAGPQVHQALQLIRASRLDGWATDEGDERALAMRFAKSIRDSSAATPGIEQHTNGF